MTVPPSAGGDARDIHSTLSPAARALLEQRAHARAAAERIASHQSDGSAPLSSSQQRLWLFSQIEPESAAYNRPRAFEIVGALDVSALERALGEVVRRHAVLRSAIISEHGVAVQQPRPAAGVSCRMIDLRDEPPTEREVLMRAAVERAARAPFDLASGEMLRAALVRTGDDVHTLLLTVHHVASDGWSDAVLFGEIGALYGAFVAGHPSPLGELALQYADYAAWQRERLASGAMSADLEYWTHRLAGAPLALELPADRPRGPERRLEGGVVRRTIPRAAVDAVMSTVGRESRATLSMTLLAAFQVLLARYSGQRDVVVGMPVAGRSRAELEPLVGCFINTLPIRTDLSDDPSFRELLARVRTTALDGYAHQEIPLDAVIEALVQRERAGEGGRIDREAPVVQVLLNVRNMPPASLELPGLTVRVVPVDTGCSVVDLSLDVTEHDDGLACVAEYASSIFDRDTIERLLGHLEALLGAIAVDPDRAVSRLPLLTPAERHRAIVEWNATAQPLGFETTLHELVARQVARTPNAIAVVDDRERVTYAELSARATRIASDLRRLGVGAETPVAVCMERSVGLVAAILGTLEAGGAYLPLDPSLRTERLQFIVSDAAPTVLLSDRASADRVPFDPDRWIVIDDAFWASPAPSVSATKPATPSSTAYIIYTSGSTGEPKGVLNTHRGACNHMLWVAGAFPFAADDAFLHKAPISFDASVGEIFGALVAGARLVMARPGGNLDSAYLARAVAEHAITMLDFVPSLLLRFLDEATVDQCRSVRWVLCGGEVMPPGLPRHFAEVMPGAELYNLYGPTEASIEISVWRCDPRSTRPSVPIGRPLPNVQLYALDEHLEPVPIGVRGELYIGGVAVAKGYLNRPELTAARFVRDPFQRDPSARLYRTGDLVRQDADGVFEYVGRDDDQVKLHGVRIELGEVEAALARHPAVRDCAVVVAPSASGDDRLVAYVVPAGDEHATAPAFRRTIREHARTLLPELLVPSAVVLMDTLPLTSSGKIDRRALPAPTGDAASAEDFVAPRTPAEEAVATIWGDVLRVPRVGLRDSFFELGGYSLAATSVVSRIRDQLQREVPLRVLFDHPVLEEFVAAIERQPAVHAAAIPTVVRARTRRDMVSGLGSA